MSRTHFAINQSAAQLKSPLFANHVANHWRLRSFVALFRPIENQLYLQFSIVDPPLEFHWQTRGVIFVFVLSQVCLALLKNVSVTYVRAFANYLNVSCGFSSSSLFLKWGRVGGIYIYKHS